MNRSDWIPGNIEKFQEFAERFPSKSLVARHEAIKGPGKVEKEKKKI